MSVRVRPHRRGGWDVDIIVKQPDGSKLRERTKLSVQLSKTRTREWAEARHAELQLHGRKQTKEVPTLEQFVPRFIDGHARANQQKPSSIAQKQLVLRVHLLPALGRKRLDAISTEDVQR